MTKLLYSCRKCINPKVLIVLGVIVVVFLIFVPIVGTVGFALALPLIGCTVMCGAMAFFMRGEKKKDQ